MRPSNKAQEAGGNSNPSCLRFINYKRFRGLDWTGRRDFTHGSGYETAKALSALGHNR